ncbi:unnamed protein product [Debaryomyces tyrocola]|nr:unnamed protein product [Debaryomyces tyrocola]
MPMYPATIQLLQLDLLIGVIIGCIAIIQLTAYCNFLFFYIYPLYPILGLIQSRSIAHTSGMFYRLINFCDSNIINIICLRNNATFHYLSPPQHTPFVEQKLSHTMPCSWTISERGP